MQTHPSNFILDIYIYIYKIFPIPQFSITILKLSIQQGRKEIGVSNISAHLQPIFVNNRFFSRYCPLELAERSLAFSLTGRSRIPPPLCWPRVIIPR